MLELYKTIRRLSQGALDSVQTGSNFSDLERYLHVHRPIEEKLETKMNEIEHAGGGIILLVGCSGDGKSHLISLIKHKFLWDDSSFYNDATASSSPNKTAIETLKESLNDFRDDCIESTTKKLVLAINSGKLTAFIDDDYVRANYSQIVNVASNVFTDNPVVETDRIKIVEFSNEQMFEMNLEGGTEYPVCSAFLSEIVYKIVAPTAENPFYQAFLEDQKNPENASDPLLINFQLLQNSEIRKSIVMYVIEAIISSKLLITPREYLDFLYSILVFPRRDTYEEKSYFMESLLPSLLFSSNENAILQAVSKLDPLRHSCTKHDKRLAILFTSKIMPSPAIPVPRYLVERVNLFYANNGRDLDKVAKFVFRLEHLFDYHSENESYRCFLHTLSGALSGDSAKIKDIYNRVQQAIPRHLGSYYAKKDKIPLNIQGGKYKLFATLTLKPKVVTLNFSADRPTEFRPYIPLKWKFNQNADEASLKVDYQLFSYIFDLNNGKLSLNFENERNIVFGNFIKSLTKFCNCTDEVTIVDSEANDLQLSENLENNVELV